MEEQITEPGLDTALGQAGDAFARAADQVETATEAKDKAGAALLEQMQADGIDKVKLHGKNCTYTVRMEHVESHDKLKATKSADKSKDESAE